MNSSLEDHKRTGNVLKPPFQTLGDLRTVSWERDYWPDMMWVCALLFHQGQVRGLHICADVLDIIDEIVEPQFSNLEERDRPIIDGRLTSFDFVPQDVRSSVVGALISAGVYEIGFPEEFAHVLGLYPAAPGRWLLDPWLEGDNRIAVNWERAFNYLAPLRIESAFHQSQLATDAKFIVLRQFVKGQKLFVANSASEGFALLPRYPNGLSENELQRARPTIRATWNMLGPSADEKRAVTGPDWARVFWRSNWHLFPCSGAEDPSSAADAETSALSILGEQRSRAELLGQELLTTARRADPDLYSPDRYEVLTGIAMRSFRVVNMTLTNPGMATEDFVKQSIRVVVESFVVMKWLRDHEKDELYTGYKDYGRGRLKLLKLHSESYLDSLGDDAPSDLIEYVEQLTEEVNNEIYEEFQNIDIGGTFSGISIRDMARRVGLESEYKLYFAPGSAATHGEWPMLDRYALSQCRNPLHRGHRLPRASDWLAVDLRDVSALVDFFEQVVETYKGAMLGNG